MSVKSTFSALVCFFLGLNALFTQNIAYPGRQALSLKPGTHSIECRQLETGLAFTATLSSQTPGARMYWRDTDAGKPEADGKTLSGTAVSTTLRLEMVLEGAETMEIWVSISQAKTPADSPKSQSDALEIQQFPNPFQTITSWLGTSCYNITNLTYSGKAEAVGLFSNGNTSVALNNGLVLSTGWAGLWGNPNTAENSGSSFGATGNDPLLATVGVGTQYDVATIDFDISSNTNILAFQYVFGSEEHCEYALSQFTDACGIFISGPGINGVENLAKVPGLPNNISVNTINFLMNNQYYVNNSIQPWNCQNLPPVAPAYCALDGWTQPLTAALQVQPCAVYHIRIAIADFGDPLFDSALFLSLGANNTTPNVEASLIVPNSSNFVYEGCPSPALRLKRTGGNINQPQAVHFTLGGTATLGADYLMPQSPIVIPAGEEEIEVGIQPLEDGLPENIETIDIQVDNGCACGNTLSLRLLNRQPFGVTMNNIKACNASQVTLSPQINGGQGPYSYYWSNGATSSSLLINQPGIQTFTVTVSDVCQLATASATVTLNQTVNLAQQHQFCIGSTITLYGQTFAQGGVYNVVLPGQNNQCDTIVQLSLTAVGQYDFQKTIALCPGEPYTINGTPYQAPDTIAFLQPGLNGACDTSKTYYLVKAPPAKRTVLVVFCTGTTVTVNGVVYTHGAIVYDTIPGGNGICDSIITYAIVQVVGASAYKTIALCPGESITIGNTAYTAPAAFQQVVDGVNNTCDTTVYYTLVLKTPAPSNVTLQCPPPINLTIPAGDPVPPVSYSPPQATSDCTCPGMNLVQIAGLASGADYPLGLTLNCFRATDACGNSATCCMEVNVQEEPPCDLKTNDCVTWELLDFQVDGEFNKTYRFRVTNACAAPLQTVAFQLPMGMSAVAPANNSVYTAPSGRTYTVVNPYFSQFYSAAFNSQGPGIANGQSDIFQYTLPPQAKLKYIYTLATLAPNTYVGTHLNAFDCTANDQKPAADDPGVVVFPNPAQNELHVSVAPQAGKTLRYRLRDASGRLALDGAWTNTDALLQISLPAALKNGWYILETGTADGGWQHQRVLISRD
jgi:hypothetical protein